jgi:hypothetical protein
VGVSYPAELFPQRRKYWQPQIQNLRLEAIDTLMAKADEILRTEEALGFAKA